jgi:hypothetical protein
MQHKIYLYPMCTSILYCILYCSIKSHTIFNCTPPPHHQIFSYPMFLTPATESRATPSFVVPAISSPFPLLHHLHKHRRHAISIAVTMTSWNGWNIVRDLPLKRNNSLVIYHSATVPLTPSLMLSPLLLVLDFLSNLSSFSHHFFLSYYFMMLTCGYIWGNLSN